MKTLRMIGVLFTLSLLVGLAQVILTSCGGGVQTAQAQSSGTTFSVGNTTTGAPGTPAIVTNSGTANNVVLNFTIPQGIAGPTGPQGLQGPAGPQGPTGEMFKGFQLTTPGSGAVSTLASFAVEAGTYGVTIEGFVPAVNGNAFPSEQVNITGSGTVQWSPGNNGVPYSFFPGTPYVVAVSVIPNNSQFPAQTSSWCQSQNPPWLTVYAKIPDSIVQFSSPGTLNVQFTDYVYGGPVNLQGVVTVHQISN